MTRALSQLVRCTDMTLAETIGLWMNQTALDGRPNKALNAETAEMLLRDYPHRELVINTILHGVTHSFPVAHGTAMLPKNHKSPLESLNALKRSIRQGQDDGTYLVVDLDVATRWGDIRFSPFGCVPKKDADPRIEARLIHDLSSTPLHSTNALPNQGEIPDVQLCAIHIIATRIENLHRQYPDLTIKMLKGDVRSAFRHIMLGSQISRWFAGSIRENNVAVLDLALPFGWTVSPGYYGIFGRAISHLVERESPSTMNPSCADDEAFFGFEYVDDHVEIEVDRENRLELAETTLRLAMMALLGPRAINETKFSLWTTKLVVLGLEWDTIARTVSMPVEKICKARLRICKLLQSGNATRHQISKLLGSLRHVCSCVRSAKPFYQRIMSQWRTLPLHGRTLLSNGTILDLQWFQFILEQGQLRSIPLNFFVALPEPDVHLYMDASDIGLCVLHPARRAYLRVLFDAEEREMIKQCKLEPQSHKNNFTINVREQLSAVLALLSWGHEWAQSVPTLSMSDVGSTTNLQFHGAIRCRVGTPCHKNSIESLAHVKRYTFICGTPIWFTKQVSGPWITSEHLIARNYRKIYNTQFSPFRCAPWPTRPAESTNLHGNNGARFERQQAWQGGYQNMTQQLNRYNWLRSPFTAGPQILTMNRQHLIPYGPKSAILDGIIASDTVADLASQTPIYSHSAAFVDQAMLHKLADITNFSNPRNRVLYGATVLGFCFLLRRSEYLAIDGKRHRYCLQVRDLQIVDANERPTLDIKFAISVQIRLRGSKNDQFGEEAIRSLEKATEPPLCPVFAAILLLQHAQHIGLTHDDPVCSLTKNHMVSAKLMTKLLRLLAHHADQSTAAFSTHSLRVGGVTALMEGGVESLSIQQHGRWKSDAFKRYTRYTKTTGCKLTSKMFKGGITY
ncbi:LOW QUALITY PROTEIN: Hypothetical protein PHPALM_8777 [Phytophthora palmivora]|uniref:Tyr recombinase domain-containing protein n=1 Tax=Phytophthora palmivora TaxID=4796 RepID=A0A2P4Y910_9STRA|nr:LOW QUALITY PROTEIN: Hypothetical protein PHPALM_8777 [Phytophthora palmivora]